MLNSMCKIYYGEKLLTYLKLISMNVIESIKLYIQEKRVTL